MSASTGASVIHWCHHRVARVKKTRANKSILVNENQKTNTSVMLNEVKYPGC
jgi:hypothetical protein